MHWSQFFEIHWDSCTFLPLSRRLVSVVTSWVTRSASNWRKRKFHRPIVWSNDDTESNIWSSGFDVESMDYTALQINFVAVLRPLDILLQFDSLLDELLGNRDEGESQTTNYWPFSCRFRNTFDPRTKFLSKIYPNILRKTVLLDGQTLSTIEREDLNVEQLFNKRQREKWKGSIEVFVVYFARRSSGPWWMMRIADTARTLCSLIVWEDRPHICIPQKSSFCTERSIPVFFSTVSVTKEEFSEGSMSIGQTFPSRFYRNTRISPRTEREDRQCRRCFASFS